MADATLPVAVDDRSPTVNVEMLIAKAIDKGDMVTVEKLLAVRKELRAEWAQEQFFAALSAFQAECPVIKRTKEGDGGKWTYAPIEQIIKQVGPLWEKHGFSHTIKTSQADMQSVTAEVHVHHRNGHEEVTKITMPLDTRTSSSGKDLQNAPQRIKSARSYAKRTALEDAYGIVTEEEDDDAQGVGRGQPEPPPEAPRKTRDVTPPANGLPPKIANILPVGAECYRLMQKHAPKSGDGLLSAAYLDTQWTRLVSNQGNARFLEALKVEIAAKVEEAKKAKGAAA